MNILFIFSVQIYQNAKKPINNQHEIQLGISHLSSLLKSKDHKTDLFVLTRETSAQLFNKFIRQFQPNLICFTAVYTEYEFISKIAKYIKSKFPSKYLLIGGPHISLNPEELLNSPFDAICIGEGEYPTLELVQQLEKGQKPMKIKNLWFKNGNKIEKNPTREFIQNLDELPFLDREMWQKWINNPDTMQVILLGRGCPFECTYCCNHSLKKISSGKYVRIRSIDNVIKELNYIIDKFPNTNEVYFEVETISVDLNFAINLCSELRKFNQQLKKHLSFGVNLRIIPNKDFEPLFDALEKANFRFINLGLESGSERIRKTILKRYYSNNDFLKIIKLAKNYRLQVSTYNMIGIPGETFDDFMKTIKCNKQCLPDWIHISVFFPYPGTELYNRCKEKGLLNQKIDIKMERRKAILDLEGFPKKQIQKEYEWFYYKVYKEYKPLYDTLGNVFFKKQFNHPVLNSIYRKLSKHHLFFLFPLIWGRLVKVILLFIRSLI